MKKITFINPLAHIKRVSNAIAIQLLKKSCEDNGIKTQFIDLSNDFIRENIEYKHVFAWLQNKLQNIKYDIVCISCIMIASFIWAIKIAEIIKFRNPDTKIIFGGPHVTVLQEMLFNKTAKLVDYLCIFEGELTIVELVKYINKEISVLPINVISYNKGIIKYSKKLQIDIPFGIIKNVSYASFIDAPILDIEVGRGCPYRCYFCSSNVISGKNVRYREPDDFLQEAQKIYELTHRKAIINFTHDNFFSIRKNFDIFVDKKVKNKFDFPYSCEGRVDAIDLQLIEKLYLTNCKSIFFGIETGSDRIQKISNKNIKIDKTIKEKVKLITDKGIQNQINFIVGFPEENLEDVLKTIELAGELSEINYNVFVNYSIMSPEPGSKIKELTKQEQYIILTESDYYKELKEAGFKIQILDPIFFNHIYTIKNKNYDIIKISNQTIKYFELLNNFPVSVRIIRKVFLLSFSEIFMILDKIEVITFLDNILKNKKKSLSLIEKELIIYEIQRYSFKKLRIKKTITYSYPIQKIFVKIKKDNILIKDILFEEKKLTCVKL